MPLYVVESDSLEQTFAMERSPEVVLVTNASDLDQMPAAVRHAADRMSPRSSITPETFRGAGNGGETIVWFHGEPLLEGTPETIRSNLRTPGRTTFSTVHFPCIPNVDLLSIQPRFFAAGKQKVEAVEFSIRIGCAAASGQVISEILREMPETWARLSYALYKDQREPGAGLSQLDRLRTDEQLPPILDALVLRNLAVLQMRHGRPQQALKLLRQGSRKYPDYAELAYLEAFFTAQTGGSARAVAMLEDIVRKPKGVFVGSGGETSYRAYWLLGVIGDMVGSQTVSFRHYYAGLCARPSFEPSVVGLLKQRLPADAAYTMQWELCHLARREPRYLEPIFYFLLVHRAFPAAQRLIDTLEIGEDLRAALVDKLNSTLPSYQKPPAGFTGPTGVVLTGPFFIHSSIARINGEIARALLSRPGLCAGLEPHGLALQSPQNVPHGDAILRGLYSRPLHLDLTIRHHWPHDFRRPAAGKLAVIVPWEFGAVPRAWVQQIERNVDELWVPSGFVRDVFIACGVRPDRIAIVPNGVNNICFSPKGKAWRPPQARGFTFLFVGGAIERKGVDVLVKAYQLAFKAREDVTLIIKDIGSSTFYQHMTQIPWLQMEAEKPGTPRMLILSDEFDETKLAELYRGCDAFVLPYRGEGFCMPLVEAMACGKPVITTAEGPASEFCAPDCTYLVPAKNVPVPGGLEGFGVLAAEPTWFEPDLDELVRLLREVYENRAEAAVRGARAGERIRSAYNWDRVTELYVDRIAALTDRELCLTAPEQDSSV